MKMEPMVITLNVHVDGDNPHLAHEFAERLMKAMSAPTVAAEQDAEQWVELDAPGCEKPYIRVSVDGERVQERFREGRWNDYDAWWIKQAYRKGREVALAEKCDGCPGQQWADDQKEAVKALVEAVGKAVIYKPYGPYATMKLTYWERIMAAAKAVQL